ncbi:class I SAM-dependent methyltransferase [Radiobacillus sp. PE A8.2]|uniref:class I SAM-dependent methyltransferase n=1 Tax=Radiobacillus sp. PE A8.2 TaxID=3380349 RepID=UPI003890F578
MKITTAGRTTSDLAFKAKSISNTYGIPYIERNGVSIKTLKEQYPDDIVVVGKDRITITPFIGGSTIFFHPNLAMIRAKRIYKGEQEPLITIAQLKEGMSFLDCTLGLASDSIIASIAVGSTGSIIGIEGNHLLALLAKLGLSSFSTGNTEFDKAMRRINVIQGDHYSYLLQAETDSADVVYFDPMFDTGIDTSNGINVIRAQALHTEIGVEVIAEAKRVARQRVVLKDFWKSERFNRLGFVQHKRKTSLFHYGTIELK